jgi:hypothetical protein
MHVKHPQVGFGHTNILLMVELPVGFRFWCNFVALLNHQIELVIIKEEIMEIFSYKS